ncbi:hypothetical protein TRAPUB_10643 [Trametes pubescens]|uniref:Uncharacterized protein n=1 Tax=Trametes pubescens TaxID=154538 RepID=A0A1M2VYZ3_TRAPU|nr:hypothetical protein TRAPUB_10643 [Trametes pubescens]
MIVAKDVKPEVVLTSPTEYEASSPGASASASSPPLAIMSPPPEQPLPTPAAHMAPPAYSVLPAAGASQPSSSTRGISDGPTLVGRDRDYAESTSSRSTNEHSAGHAFSRGLLVMVLSPVAAFLAALWGAGKLVEGIGKGLSMGPEAAYKAHQAREERRIERRANRRAKRRNAV